MRLPDANPMVLQRATTGFQTLQALFIPIIMGVTGASMLQANAADSSSKFMFALCWLTIPALIYVAMTPRFARTKPLSNPYAICGFNCLICFFWFVAPIALGVYNTKAQQQGYDKIHRDFNNKAPGAVAEADLPSSPSCNTTTGTPKECSLNHADVGLAVFNFLFWFATTLMAIYVALYYRVHLITPWEAHSAQIGGEQVTEHTKQAFGEDDPQGVDYALINDEERSRSSNTPYSAQSMSQGASQYDDDYERQMARDGEGHRSRSVGSGSYDAGRVGFPDGDYAYTGAGR